MHHAVTNAANSAAVGALKGAMTIGLALALGACSSSGQDANPPAEATPTVVSGAADAGAPSSVERTSDEPDVEVRIDIDLPPIPVVALPDISVLGAAGDLVSEQLGDLVTPVSGVDVVAADCASEGGELIYQGSTGDDVFNIDRDGSGVYLDESDDGLVTLKVNADGSGNYYEQSGSGLVTIEVEPDGSGTYYHDQPNGLVTVQRAGDGSGEYYDNREAGLLTISIGPDGSGRYYREADDGSLLTIDASPDGFGQYYRKVGDEQVTLDLADDSGWTLASTTMAYRQELKVQADGSGRFIRTGLEPVNFEFDATGLSVDGRTAARIAVPERPRLAVIGRFPPLGKLGSLAPPCAAVLRFDASLLFEFDEANIRPEATDTLDEVALALIKAGLPIEINGHSDSLGDEEYNLELSLRRAEAVETALRQRGFQPETTVEGFGEQRPVAPNEDPDGQDDPAGRSLNRRVEIIIREGG